MLSNPYRRTAMITWALLCILSFSSVMVSGGLTPSGATVGTWASALVLVISFIKVRMVVMHFMEVSDSPLALRIAFEVWIFGALAALLVLLHLHTVQAFLNPPG